MIQQKLNKPFWVNGEFKWYKDTVNQEMLTSKMRLIYQHLKIFTAAL